MDDEEAWIRDVFYDGVALHYYEKPPRSRILAMPCIRNMNYLSDVIQDIVNADKTVYDPKYFYLYINARGDATRITDEDMFDVYLNYVQAQRGFWKCCVCNEHK